MPNFSLALAVGINVIATSIDAIIEAGEKLRDKWADGPITAMAQRATSDVSGDPAPTDGAPPQDEKINYLQLGDQARQLINLGYTIALLIGLWWIWSDVVPAFGFLNQVELPISTSKLVDGVSK